MNVSIFHVIDKQFINAKIVPPSGVVLPSITDGWRFNFKKHSKKPGFQAYILVTEGTPNIIEGCLIFQLRDTVEPYMAYIELAPHNKGKTKTYKHVAGCLIAFACRLSFVLGMDHFKGWLTFDVIEESKEDEMKLIAVYCTNYGALKWGETTMVISPEIGEKLINKFLNYSHEK
ncbi:hypothetical protein [Dyadobacter sp. CY347]|uniref:hypothetical protein n=1 Tax=Dyadobacter sp. CY347 TaxID=2909336 RepID=UPI001F194482|nr:hypothetical protein [Dyadobacter sp. CY347]MCF2489200.1 hypothetical protein [Dyadobacter sp. CY347]